jgi:hypothetical protein
MAEKNESESQHKEIYQKISDKAKKKDTFSTLDLKTILNHLIRLPEVYKLDFLNIYLSKIFDKCSKERDSLIHDHYKHYVSIPCLSALLDVFKNSKGELGKEIELLLDHIRNLPLQPGPSAKDIEKYENLQYDLITLLNKFKSDKKEHQIDLRSPVNRKKLAELYYDRILKSFISEDEDALINEDEFLKQIRTDILKSKEVQEFASRTISELTNSKKNYLKELGTIIDSSILKTYLENYKGVFNGDRESVLKSFEEIIENRFLDHEDGSSIDLDQISAGIIAHTLELVFNSGIAAFRNEINNSVYKSFKGD